jgi:hypothetical protein
MLDIGYWMSDPLPGQEKPQITQINADKIHIPHFTFGFRLPSVISVRVSDQRQR